MRIRRLPVHHPDNNINKTVAPPLNRIISHGRYISHTPVFRLLRKVYSAREAHSREGLCAEHSPVGVSLLQSPPAEPLRGSGGETSLCEKQAT